MARRREPAAARSALQRRPGRGGTVLLALSAGLAGGLLAPLVFPSAARGARPAAKRAVKMALALYERGRETAAGLGERASDLLAEAQAEFAAEHGIKGADAEPETADGVVALHAAGAEPRNV